MVDRRPENLFDRIKSLTGLTPHIERHPFDFNQEKLNRLTNSEKFQDRQFKKLRNIFKRSAKNDKKKFFSKKISENIGKGNKLDWELVNRAKGKITTKTEDIAKQPDYCPTAMAEFFQKRSKMVYKSRYTRADLDGIDPEFPIHDFLVEYKVDIKIDDDLIDKMMKYKPSPSPDPDSLSMQIWSKVYFNNLSFQKVIRGLFYMTFEKTLKIPGLSHRDVTLLPKVDEVKRQKDFRPIASLPSIPKRMLKILYTQIKTKNKNKNKSVFYAKNDFSTLFSAPGRGSVPAVISTYENLQRMHFGLTGRPKQNYETRSLL